MFLGTPSSRFSDVSILHYYPAGGDSTFLIPFLSNNRSFVCQSSEEVIQKYDAACLNAFIGLMNAQRGGMSGRTLTISCRIKQKEPGHGCHPCR